MKKILSILSTGLAILVAASCSVKEDITVMDPSLCTPPVVTASDVAEDGITVNFTPATLNVKAPVYHTLVMTSLKGSPVDVILNSIEKDGVLTLTPDALSRTLLTLGCQDGDVVSLEMVVRASPQQKMTGKHAGYVDSDARISVNDFTVTIPKGSPYMNYTEMSEWSLIGAMSAYGINWDGDLNMWTDGNGNHVAAHVTLKAGDEVKFRKDLAWTENRGGVIPALDTEFDVTPNGDNIVIDKDGVYDLYLYLDKGKAMVTAAYDPYPEFTEASNWSVIGDLTLHEINWNGDLAMISDGTWHVALGVKLDEDDEFKFRQDAAWTVNLGGTFEALDAEFPVVQNGDNIKVGAAGEYDIFVNPDAGTAKVSTASGAKVSSVVGGVEPPTPETVTGWNIIGLNGDWDNDVLATQDGNVWTAFITAESETEFKWRKDGGWDENYGGTFVELGKPFEAVAGGDNIKVGAGFYKVELNLDDMTITVSNGQVWSLIGDFNEWAGDVDMTLTDGKWVSPVTKISGKFKIRENHGWDNNRGGVFVAVGEPFSAVAGGDDITVEEGNYVVTYDPEAETIVIDETGWGLVGTINGWGNTPDIILKEDGLFLVARNVALTDSDEIKIRYKSDWAENRGGRTAVGHAVKAIPGGDNIKPGVAGNYDVWYRPDSEVLFVMPAGTVLTYWGVVGTINGWGAPDRIMYEDENGQFVYEDLEVTATDEIKIRVKEDWAENRGGTFADLDRPFPVENGGPNIVVGRDATVTVTYDPSAETITLSGEYHGDAPEFPEYIYAIGGDTGWSDVYPLHGKNGQYKGFGYLSQEFKFRPNEDNWDGDWECVGEGQIGQGSDNCPAPEAGYYMIEVDLNEMTYQVTAITTIGIIGPAQAGGWDTDTDMTYNQAEGCWEIKGVTLSADMMKFRANDGWDINWGGSLDNLVQGGDNIAVEAGTYDIVLYALCDGEAYATMTPAGSEPAGGITIDGDMSDWADIEGSTSEGVYKSLKATNDDEFFYIYSMRNKKRGNELWGSNKGYYYYDFDIDDNPDTGDYAEGSHGNFEAWMYLYLFGGTPDAPAFWESPNGDGKPSSSVIANVLCKGVVDDNPAEDGLIETEVRIPRANLPAVQKGQTISITSWGNKDANLMKVTITVK